MNATITNPLNLFLLNIGVFLGLTLGLFLLFNKSAKNRANRYLGILILAITTYFLIGFFYRFELLNSFPHIIGVQSVSGFLIGPLAYFYVRACTQQGFQIRSLLWLHFLPFVFDVLLNIPNFLQSGAEKLAIYEQFVQEGYLQQSTLLLILKTIHGTIYYSLAVHTIWRYKQHLTNASSYIDTAFHRWVLLFLSILAFPILGLVGFSFNDFQRILILLVLLCFFSFLLAVYIAIIVKPELFHAFPHQMLLPESSEEQKQKYENSKLQTIQKDKYLAKIITYVEREKPYQSTELTLAELAEKVKIPAHYVSQVINEKLTVNFLDFINGYRVRAAQKMLMDSEWSHYTIISIAYEAGFNAKSTFYAVFKKQTGMTPSQYRKQAKITA